MKYIICNLLYMTVVLVVNFEFSATIFTFIGVGEWIIFDNAFFCMTIYCYVDQNTEVPVCCPSLVRIDYRHDCIIV